jgi:UTP-glucose-1-phosphate uridylyltransferase
MRAVAGARAKELLPVGGRPLIAHGLLDLAAAGVTEALVVVSPDKPELARELGARVGGVALTFVEQPVPLGVADAIALAEPFAAGEPFFCWLPDNLWSAARNGGRSASAQLAAARAHHPGASFVGLIEVPGDQLARFGSAGFVESTPVGSARDRVRIDRVLPKGTRPDAGGAPRLKGFPLDLYGPDVFDRIRRERAALRTAAARELDDTPILAELAGEGRLIGVVLRDGRLFDCGIPEGYRDAVDALGT